VSTSLALGVLRVVASGLKDASRRRSRRSPSAILDPGRPNPAGGVCGRDEGTGVEPNQGTFVASGEADGAGVAGGVVGLTVLPSAPQHAHPGSCEDADGVGVLASTPACLGVDGIGPCGSMAGVVGEAGDGCPQIFVARSSEHDAAAFARCVRDRADAGLGGELVFGGEALAHVTEFGEDLGGVDAPSARKRHDDPAVRQLDLLRFSGEALVQLCVCRSN